MIANTHLQPIIASELIQQIGRLCKGAACAPQGTLGSRKALPKYWQYLVTKKVTTETSIIIAFVVYPRQLMLDCPGFDLIARRRQEWSQDTQTSQIALLTHRRRTVYTTTSEQIKKHRLSLVTVVMRQHQHPPLRNDICKGGITCRSCSGLNSKPTGTVYRGISTMKRDAKAITIRLAKG